MLTLEDKYAVGELIARYAHCADFQDWEGQAKLFVPEVETEMEGQELRFRGIEEQVAHSKVSAEWTKGKNRHYNFNLIVSEQDGEVVADYMFMNVNAGEEAMGAQIVVTGRMRDTVVKTAEGWKFARRLVRFDQNVSVHA